MTEDRKALLQRLWDAGTPVTRIAQELGFAQRTSVSHAVRRMGLPPREPNRTTERAQEVNRQRIAARRAQAEAEEHDPEMPDPPNSYERPTCWVCGGAAANWDGHDGCRGRRKAA